MGFPLKRGKYILGSFTLLLATAPLMVDEVWEDLVEVSHEKVAAEAGHVQDLANLQQCPLHPLRILICSPYLLFWLGFWGELHYLCIQSFQRHEFGGKVSL